RLLDVLAIDARVTAPCAAQRPGGTPGDHVQPPRRFDLLRGHAAIEVPGGVVGANIIEAEPVMLMERIARARRSMLTGGPAAFVVARPQAAERVAVAAEIDDAS